MDLPQNYVTEDGVWLGKWVYLQRERYRKQKENNPGQSLSREQIEALETIGMDWQAPGERAWEKAFGRARAYYERNHHLETPGGYETEDGFRLDLWVKRQRKQYRERNGKVLTEERIVRLESLGMRW